VGRTGRGRRDDDEGPAEDAAGRVWGKVVWRPSGEGSGLVMVFAMVLVELYPNSTARDALCMCCFVGLVLLCAEQGKSSRIESTWHCRGSR
jgi:hypothetical protein